MIELFSHSLHLKCCLVTEDGQRQILLKCVWACIYILLMSILKLRVPCIYCIAIIFCLASHFFVNLLMLSIVPTNLNCFHSIIIFNFFDFINFRLDSISSLNLTNDVLSSEM